MSGDSFNVVTMPKLSDTMEDGKIFAWLVKEGEYIDQGDALLEIETDKATMEYPAPESGYLKKILVAAGESGELGAAIAVLTDKQDAVIDLEKLLSPSDKSSKNISISQHDDLAQKNTASKSFSMASDKLALANGVDKDSSKSTLTVYNAEKSNDRIKISPLAAKLCKEHNINPSVLELNASKYRIVKQDVLDYIKTSDDKYLSESIKSVEDHQSIDKTKTQFSKLFTSNITKNKLAASVSNEELETIVELSPMRKAIAHNLCLSKQQIPHYYLKATFKVDKLLAARTKVNQYLLSVGLSKVSINDYIVLACGKALKLHPVIRSSYKDDHIIQYNRINISVAVAIDEGLITPVVFDVDKLSLYELSYTIKDLVQKSRSATRSGIELSGGCFTISNLGNSKVDQFCAVINPPQAAILAVGAVSDYVALESNVAVIKKQITVTMSCDHRVIDGKVGSEFLDTLGEYLENPQLLLI